MAAKNFEAALTIVLREEGGYADHPADPGGATMMGVTQATLSDWRGYGVSKAEVKSLSRTEAAAIYRARYWDAVKGDELPAGLDLALFDLAVNSGPKRAVKLLQRALGIAEDGALGPVTMRAAKAGHTPFLIAALMAERRRFLEALKGWAVFGRGWKIRLTRIEKAARALADGHRATVPVTQKAPAHIQVKEKTMDDVKPLLTSKTVWANVFGLIAIVLSLFGFNTSLLDPQALAESVLQAIAALSFVLSTAFRVVATKRIG
jgi:lysozyme family protein